MGVFEHWPNRITALRFLGALGLFAILAAEGNRQAREQALDRGWIHAAFWAFLIVAVTDVLDGWLARRGNHVTAFGRIADPFVDKVLVMGTMVFLAVMPWSQPWFPAWIVVVILAREFLVTAVRGYVESHGGTLPADWFGKVKMFTQCTALGIVLGLHAFEFSDGFRAVASKAGHVFVWLTLITSIGSALAYLTRTRRYLLETAG
jgi:CDP-diacylglycerol--glycerol-3-phosphate 3-phosphatidyltransferase